MRAVQQHRHVWCDVSTQRCWLISGVAPLHAAHTTTSERSLIPWRMGGVEGWVCHVVLRRVRRFLCICATQVHIYLCVNLTANKSLYISSQQMAHCNQKLPNARPQNWIYFLSSFQILIAMGNSKGKSFSKVSTVTGQDAGHCSVYSIQYNVCCMLYTVQIMLYAVYVY